MPIEVILIEDVPGLGYTGDLVRVSAGYARNFLLPRNLAAPATDATRKRVAKLKTEAEQRRARDREAAQALATRVAAVELKIPVRAGSEGKLFGSVTASDIAERLTQQGIAVQKQQVALGEPIKSLGDHKVSVRLTADVGAELKVVVVAE